MKTEDSVNSLKKELSIPVFIDKSLLNKDQINDPDYRLKFLQDLYGSEYTISCSKCHHCR